MNAMDLERAKVLERKWPHALNSTTEKNTSNSFVFGLECVTTPYCFCKLKGVSGTCYNLYLAVFLA